MRESKHAFQSSPSLSEGRYHVVPLGRVGVDVSILALPFGRALQEVEGVDNFIPEFQSSPSLSEGRYCADVCQATNQLRFQSSPSLSEGRYLQMPMRPSISLPFQSSPSLSEGRYRVGG